MIQEANHKTKRHKQVNLLAFLLIAMSIMISQTSQQRSRVFVNLDRSMVPCNQELLNMLEDEMIELQLMKQLWSNVSSDTRLYPGVKTARTGGNEMFPQYQVNITGLMNNSILNDGDRMVGSAAWLNYPISLYDLTKVNFTLNWSKAQCSLQYNTLINCSPQGGFAIVFQQESTNSLGEYKNNLGQGLGYEGLSGIFAIEFDTQANIHKNPADPNQLRISMQIRNKNVDLLSSRLSSTFKSNSQPVNFASFNLSGFSQSINVQLGLISNQLNQEIMIVLDMNGMRQLEVKTTFDELGLDPSRTYFFGFTSAQNLNKNAPTASLDILNFRLFKGKPKFVDGQVSYIGDSVGLRGNQSNLEIRSSFYDLCMQKTTLVVYPTISEQDWLTAQETEPHIIPFFNNRDTMVIGSSIQNINKPQFYSPSSRTISPDVKFQLSLPTGVTTNVRMGFYYYSDLIMNITSIDYFKKTNSNYTFLVIKDSDLITSTLTTKGYANNNYQFDVFYYDGQLNPVAVDFSQLSLTVTSDYIRLNNTIYNNQVPLTCYRVSSSSNSASSGTSTDSVDTKASQFTCQFLPNVNGTYFINSPFLPSGRSFKVDIGQADQVNEILSSEYSQAIVNGDFEVDAGSTIEIYIDLRNNLNNTYIPQTQEGCTFTNSYYFLNGQKYSFLFYDVYPYLRTTITQAGVADFKISITCTRVNFDLQCFRCQKVIKPLSTYLYYKMTIPSFPSQFDSDLSQNLMLKQSSNLVLDITFFDRFDNQVPSELDNSTLNSFNAQFVYGKSKQFNFQKIQVPGKVYMFLNDTENLFVQSLRARTNLYFLNIQSPGNQQCLTIQSETKKIYFVAEDKVSPMEIIGDGDVNRVDQNLTTVYWDRVIAAGKIARFHLTLKNPNNLYLNSWLPTNNNTFIDVRIQDNNMKSVLSSDCFVKLNQSLYEGEYFGFYYCKSAPKYYIITIMINGVNVTTPMAFTVVPNEPTNSNLATIVPTTQTYTLGSGGININFRLNDDQGNNYTTILLNREQTQLGLITYNLTSILTNKIVRYNILPQQNVSQGLYRLHIDNIPVGRYRLQINLPVPIIQDLTFISSSLQLSPFYSFVVVDSKIDPAQQSINNYIFLRFYARNIHNQSLTDLSQANQIFANTQIQLTCSNGQVVNFIMSGTFPSADGVYFNFTSQDRLKSNGLYTITVFQADFQTFIYVKDGVFSIFDNFDPINSDLYLVKGMDEREYRLAPFDVRSQLSNQYNATYYDPRFDGNLRFKFYLRTSLYGEIVTNPKFQSYNLWGGYIATAVYSNNAFNIGTNITNLSLKLVNFTNYLMLVPETQAEQDKIEQLIEGYYFVVLTGTSFNNKFSIQWLFSLFNSDAGQQNTASPPAFQLLAPRFINVTAGEPFTFVATAIGGTPSITNLTVIPNSEIQVEIETTSKLVPAQNHFYVTLFHTVAGIYTLQLQATYQRGSLSNPPKDVIIQVNPAPFYSVLLVNQTQLAKRIYNTGQFVSINFTLVDRYNNSLLIFERNRPPLQKFRDLIQLVHNLSDPIISNLYPIANTTLYNFQFTTNYAGNISFLPTLQNYTLLQIPQNMSINITFQASQTEPSIQTSFAQIRQTNILAGANVTLDIYLRDMYGNNINLTQNRNNYLVNIIPDNLCNSTTQVMSFLLQRLNIITFGQNLTTSCHYDFKVFYFSPIDGQIEMPCLNCHLLVDAAVEDIRKIDFLDQRDVIVNSLNKLNLFINKNDTNPKLIMVFRDVHDNLVLSQQSQLSLSYQFDIVPLNSENVIYRGLWQAQKSFHYLQFCEKEFRDKSCFGNFTNGLQARLRLQSLNGTRSVNKLYINIVFVDNSVTLYNSDDLNDISSKYSYLRILNQDVISSLAYDLRVIQEVCIGGEQYPIIGRLDLKTIMGFRKNESFEVLQQRISLVIDGLDAQKYSFNEFSGSMNGIIMFTIFLKDDFYNDKLSTIARVMIDGKEFTNRKIQIRCRRRMNYQKFVVAQNGTLLTSLENNIIQAGQQYTFKMTATDPSMNLLSQFRPFDSKIVFNYTNPIVNMKGDFIQITEDVPNNNIIYQIKFSLAGTALLVGSQINSQFQMNIVPGTLHAKYSIATSTFMRIRAGENSTILISPFDEFGNQITFTNTIEDLKSFNSLSQVYLAKINLFGNEQWSQVSCFEIFQNKIKCSAQLTQKGIYKWRTVINGYTAQCANCYVRVVPSGRYNHNKTVLTDLSQNYYGNQYLAFSKFNVQNRNHGLYYKFYISDEFDNIYVNEDFIQIDNITARISFISIDAALNVTKLHKARTGGGCQVYSAVIFPTNILQMTIALEGFYRIQVVITNATVPSTASFYTFFKANRTSASYPSVLPANILRMRFREQQFQQLAGQFQTIQFGIFDDNSVLQVMSQAQQFQFTVAAQFNSTTFNGDIMLGPFKYIYVRLLKINLVNQTDIINQLFAQQYSVTVQITNPSYSITMVQFTTYVFPGPLNSIRYLNNNIQFQALDAFNNSLDHNYDSSFIQRLIINRTSTQSQPNFQLANFNSQMNYSSRLGEIQFTFDGENNLTNFFIFDSNLKALSNPFSNYLDKGILDFSKSYFEIITQQITAGQSIQVKITLVDSNYQRINITSNSSALTNLVISFLKEDQLIERSVNLQQFKFNNSQANSWYTVPIQVNISGNYLVQVQFYGQNLMNRFGSDKQKWIYVKNDEDAGNSSQPEMQWGISIIAIQRNKVFGLSSQNGTDYFTFLKTQPLYFLARITDRFGNAFEDPDIYEFYNKLELALETRIINFGRAMQIDTTIIYNVILIGISTEESRNVYRNYMPSYYPLQNNNFYNSLNSYKIEVYSPGKSQSIKMRQIFIVLDTDFEIDKTLSRNQTSNQEIDSNNPILSDDLINNQIQLRLNKKAIYTFRVMNTDQRYYFTESVQNFQMEITNTTQTFVINSTNPKNITNTSVILPVSNVSIKILPFANQGFYRAYLVSNALFQDPSPLNLKLTIKTTYKYSKNPISKNLPVWVFPPTPPNFLNQIINSTYLAKNQTKFRPATKIQFPLTLGYNNMTFLNDQQSARNIKIYRKSSLEQVNGELAGKSNYSISVNLEGPQRNEFRIYYKDFNGALYPLTQPEVIYFEIQSSETNLKQISPFYSEEYQYPKLGFLPDYFEQNLGQSDLYQNHPRLLQSLDLTKIKIVIITNMINNNYIIGNEFRASILVVDNQTSRCLLESDYSVSNDLVVTIYRYDPLTMQLSGVSIDIPFINLVKNIVRQPTSYCTFYSNAVLESSSQLNTQGNYTLIATFKNLVTSNITFQVLVSGIDFRQTTVGWYQQPLDSNQMIAEINAYEEFNYLIYFKDAQGNYVSERTSFVKIRINFDGQKLIEGTDYKYISRYDDRFKGYLITIQFFKAGSFKPEYYFNLQRAENIQVSDGPILFFVYEPQCIKVQALSKTGTTLALGQLFNFVFNCYDINGKLISESIKGVQSQALFQNIDQNNLQSFGTIEALSNGIYKVSNKFYMEGRYNLKVYFNSLLIYNDPTLVYKVQSEICKDPITGQLMFKCPNNPSICAYNYYECSRINTTTCPSSAPFLCGDGKCVSSMSTQCCRISDRNLFDYLWCPNTNQCFNSTLSTCPTINTTQPLYCESQNKYVTHQYECCEDLKYNTSVKIGNNQTVVTKSMTKCSNEDKCVPSNTAEFCFYKFNRNCTELFGSEFSFQCPNNGKCKRNPTECPNPRVCPFGYTQCPDYSCIMGLDKFNQCNRLLNCSRTLPDGSQVEFIRCADGSCAKTYEECPQMITCTNPNQVVCPDGTCKNSQFECIQTLECTSDKSYKCPGFPTVCASSRLECPIPAGKTCGGTLQLCENGECANSCRTSQFNGMQTSIASMKQNDCTIQGLIQCPNFECRSSYYECSDTLFCPLPINYTYAASTVICPAAQICSIDQKACSYPQCSSILNYQYIGSQNSYDHITQTQVSLGTCYDGRCHLSDNMKQKVCMTPISCSFTYFKSGGFGEFCVSSQNKSIAMMEIAIITNDYKCAKNKFKCVTGECRNSLDDCPSQITCPSELPVQCRDGQCVRSKSQCLIIDQEIEKNLMKCGKDGLLLCTSDLITCTTSLSKCPARSTCPIGFIKCWDESCVNPVSQSCPKVTQLQQLSLVSTCPDQNSNPFHCFSDGSCRASLHDCATQTYCPLSRPVKCMDGSCRSSIKNCPINIKCPAGYKYCSGESTCVKLNKLCGTISTCSEVTQYRCEDGSCVQDAAMCQLQKYQHDDDTLDCLFDETKILCQNGNNCVSDIMECKISDSCLGTNLVKAQNTNLCYKSRSDFSSDLVVLQTNQLCSINNQYLCQNGQCSDEPCPEWDQCQSPKATKKCWNGQCVTDLSLCPMKNNSCPFYKQIRCKYTGTCVSNITFCYSSQSIDDKANQQIALSYCSKSFNLNYACEFDGSCVQSSDQCNTSQYTGCANIYPNSVKSSQKCYVPQCPEAYPFKCSSGLCVTTESDCPLYQSSVQDLQFCQDIARQSGKSLFVPCGNGKCVSHEDECLPLYDCSLNSQNLNFFRCGDGTCRAKPSDCPLQDITCPSHLPYMCQNGMCSQSEIDCIKNENGCPQRTPLKCPFDGSCTTSISLCQSPYNQMAQMFIYPNYIPEIRSTPLIAYYGITRSQCQKNGQFICKLGTQMPYCVDRLTNCKDPDTGCDVTNPIRCGASCVSSPYNCTQVSCADINAEKCPSSSVCVATSTITAIYSQSVRLGAQPICDVWNGCPANQSFICPNINRKQCAQLPYTSYPSLFGNTCTTFDRSSTLQLQTNIFNECFSQDTPYSCADGSCVSDINLCPTCIYYCPNYRRCVKQKSECDFLTSTSIGKSLVLTLTLLQQSCPISTPYRCIISGQCVANEIDCKLIETLSQNSQYNQTFHGNLLTDRCPLQSPIRCHDGRCANQYDDCFKQIRSKSFTNPDLAYIMPISWGQNLTLLQQLAQSITPADSQSSNNLLNLNNPCQVYCYDGSCRDRVENCPVIHGCFDYQRPFRCKNGLCARDQQQCQQIYGSMADQDLLTIDYNSQCSESFGTGLNFTRCEDGVCRPMSYNTSTQQWDRNCLPYMGCPLSEPYHCSTGECVKDKSQCAGSSKCPLHLPFRCKNLECVSQLTVCERPFSTYSSLQLDITLDPLQDLTIDFAFTDQRDVIGKLQIVSNSLQLRGLENIPSQLMTYQRIQVYPVQDSILEKIQNYIPQTRIEYLERIYPITVNNTLKRAFTMISPAVKIEYNSAIKPYIDYGFLYFKLDNASFPKDLNIYEDACLGWVTKLDQLDQGKAQWQCQQREIEIDEDGFLKFKINQLGIYAVIVNPNPDLKSNEDCGFMCQNNQTLLIMELSLVVLVALLLYAFCICCHAKAPVLKSKKHKDQTGKNVQYNGRSYTQNQMQYLSPGMGAINNTTLFNSPDKVWSLDGNIHELDVEQLKDQLESVDPNDPPLMPGQYVLLMAQQNDTQQRQIDVLKSQLQQYQEREIDNLSLIKAIFEKNKILHAQIELKQEIESKDNLNNTKRSNRSRRPRKIKEDPSIVSEYNNIDAYLAQSMMGSRYQDHPQMIKPLLDNQESKATFQEYPADKDARLAKQLRGHNNDNSMLSIPNNHLGDQMLVTESTKQLISKNYKSTSKLEVQENKHMNNILIQDELNPNNDSYRQDDNEKVSFMQSNDYSRRIGELAEEIQQLEQIEEEKEEEQSLVKKKKKKRATIDEQNNSVSNVRDSLGIEQSILQKTLNSIFPQKRRGPSDTKGYNMMLGNESITGNVSGSIIKNDRVEPDMVQAYQDYVNSKDEDQDEDEMNEENSYARLKEIEQLMKTSPSKKKKQKPLKKK